MRLVCVIASVVSQLHVATTTIPSYSTPEQSRLRQSFRSVKTDLPHCASADNQQEVPNKHPRPRHQSRYAATSIFMLKFASVVITMATMLQQTQQSGIETVLGEPSTGQTQQMPSAGSAMGPTPPMTPQREPAQSASAAAAPSGESQAIPLWDAWQSQRQERYSAGMSGSAPTSTINENGAASSTPINAGWSSSTFQGNGAAMNNSMNSGAGW